MWHLYNFLCNDSDVKPCHNFHCQQIHHQIPSAYVAKLLLVMCLFLFFFVWLQHFLFVTVSYFCFVLSQISTKPFCSLHLCRNDICSLFLSNEQCVNNDQPHTVCQSIFNVNDFSGLLSYKCIFSTKDSVKWSFHRFLNMILLKYFVMYHRHFYVTIDMILTHSLVI